MQTITVQLAGSSTFSYDIHIGYGIGRQMGTLVRESGFGDRYMLVTDTNLAALYGEPLLGELKKASVPAGMIVFPAGEASKNIGTALTIVRQLLQAGADRKTVLLALGGGVVGDVTGFVASLYMRSIPYIQIPTSLVAQVDSSIGGKTAVDLPEGKNLLGTFYQPRAVLTDPSFLETLPAAEFRNGLAEVVKYGIIDRGDLFALLEKEMTALQGLEKETLSQIIFRCCEIKKRLVEIDEKDRGPRHFLNFGHTLGHALEAASDYRLAHGSGVSLGMMAALRLSERIGGLVHEDRVRAENLIGRTGLPTAIPVEIGTDLIMSKLASDKKKSGQTINFVLVRNIGEPFVTGEVKEEILRETIEELKR